MTLQKLNIAEKIDNPVKRKYVESGGITEDETLLAGDVNSMVNKINEIIDYQDEVFNLKVNTIAELRKLEGKEEGQIITLLGYYQAGDKEPLNYKWTLEQSEDDGGSIINSSKGSWEAVFSNEVKISDYGVVNDGLNQLGKIQLAILKHDNLIFDVSCYLDVTNLNNLKLRDNSNIKFINNCIINIIPNSLTNYKVFDLNRISNVVIEGAIIIGDKYTHTGSTGEWGMGINITNGCDNITILKANISKCWGDGIYIGGSIGTEVNTNIKIQHSIFNDNRRQGLSVTYVDGLIIDNSIFSNTEGTEPSAGIDLEPNNTQYVRNVTINNVECFGNKNGILIYNEQRQGAQLYNIFINGLKVHNNRFNGCVIMEAYNVFISSSVFENNNSYGLEIPRDVKNSTFSDCLFVNNNSHGFAVVTTSMTESVSDIIFNNCSFNNNGANTTGDGFRIDSIDDTGMINNINFYFCQFRDQKEINTQRYGISKSSKANITNINLYYTIPSIGNTISSRTGVFNVIDVTNHSLTRSGDGSVRPTISNALLKRGDTYWNVGTNKLEVWDGSIWKNSINYATATSDGLLRKSVAVNDITTANAVDLATALTLVNELKSKLNEKLQADRNSGQQLAI